MINATHFYEYLLKKRLDFFSGVPDSLLQGFCSCLAQRCPAEKHIITANEGNAVALAGGYHMATGKTAVVYMQNSGIGNAVNPLLSFAHDEVYRIPMLLLVGWRGEPGVKDEPQHTAQGRLTIPLLQVLELHSLVASDGWQTQLDALCTYMEQTGKPAALIIRQGSFTADPLPIPKSGLPLLREQAISTVMNAAPPETVFTATTGKTARELFALRKARGESHAQDFLTVGSMGHTASIALGMAVSTQKPIYCLDGDGSFLMHMGSLCVTAQRAGGNFRYILLNNGAHESVGGQPTVAFAIDAAGILRAAGFTQVETARTQAEMESWLHTPQTDKPAALVIEVRQGSRPELGRPESLPQQNKEALMRLFAQEKRDV